MGKSTFTTYQTRLITLDRYRLVKTEGRGKKENPARIQSETGKKGLSKKGAVEHREKGIIAP